MWKMNWTLIRMEKGLPGKRMSVPKKKKKKIIRQGIIVSWTRVVAEEF